MKYECLKLEERRIIEEMYAKGAKPGEIAERVGKRIAVLCGVSPAEALFMAPGEVFDLWELYLSAHGKNRGEEGV